MNGPRSFVGHALDCQCCECSDATRLREQRLTLDGPTGGLHEREVSLRELSDVRLPPTFSIGEDWSDD